MPVSRRVLIRIVGAPLLLALLGGLLYWGHVRAVQGLPNAPLQWLILVVWLVCLREFQGLCEARGNAMPNLAVLGLASTVLARMFRIAVGGTWSDMAGGAGVLTAVLLLQLVFQYGRLTPEAAGLSLLGFTYVSLLEFLLVPPIGPAVFYLLFLLACGKGSDMAAYVVGKSLGRHRMAPVVSPNKTWEGAVGGAIVGTGAGLAVILATPLRGALLAGVPVAALLGLALVVTMAAQVGDLVKSAFKRWAGVKDSGRLLPEFGGMLDLVDSFLTAAPVAHFGVLLLQGIFRGA
jgi:phosphatidate cytidylyltransferase